MALDHYVSQVYLKNFYAPELESAFYASRKNVVRLFTQSAKNVCRIEQGNTNEYLIKSRIIEELLRTVEPYYNQSVAHLENDTISKESIYVIACFISYILTCSPAAMRIRSEPLKETVAKTCHLSELIETMPISPTCFNGNSLSELINAGEVKINIDPKYPQAIGISGILSATNMLGNAFWEILHNPFPDNPFFTSDYPVCIEKSKDPRILNRIFPLTPYLAIRIHPNVQIKKNSIDFNFNYFKKRVKKLSIKDVSTINKTIVRCAEGMVFSKINSTWVTKFIERNANYRIESNTKSVPTHQGFILHSCQRIEKYTQL